MGSGVLHDTYVYTSQADAIVADLATEVALVVGERMGVRVVCNTRELERELNERNVSGVRYERTEDDGALRVRVDSTPPVEWVVRVSTVPPVTKPQRPAPLALPPIPTSDDKAEALRYFDAVMDRLADHVFSAVRDSTSLRASILYQRENGNGASYDFVEKLCHIHGLEAQCVFVGWLEQELLIVGRVIDDAVSVLRKSFDTLSLASWSYLPLTMEEILRRLKRVQSLYHFLVTSKEVSGLLGAKGISGLRSTLSRIERVVAVFIEVELVLGVYETAVPVMDELCSPLGIQRAPNFQPRHFLSAVPLLLRNATRREATILEIERILNAEPNEPLLTEKEVDEITKLLARGAVAGIHFKISGLTTQTEKGNFLGQIMEPEESEPDSVAERLIKNLQKVVDSRGIEKHLFDDMAWRKSRVKLPNGETIVGNRLYKSGAYTVGIWVSWRMFVCWVALPQDLSSTGECSWLVFYVMNETEVQRGYELMYRGASDPAAVPTEESVKSAAVAHPGFVFGSLDTDGDSRIDLGEYRAAFASGSDSGSAFKMLDKDEDGQLTENEWQAGAVGFKVFTCSLLIQPIQPIQPA
jgi:hypothetical protein